MVVCERSNASVGSPGERTQALRARGGNMMSCGFGRVLIWDVVDHLIDCEEAILGLRGLRHSLSHGDLRRASDLSLQLPAPWLAIITYTVLSTLVFLWWKISTHSNGNNHKCNQRRPSWNSALLRKYNQCSWQWYSHSVAESVYMGTFPAFNSWGISTVSCLWEQTGRHVQNHNSEGSNRTSRCESKDNLNLSIKEISDGTDLHANKYERSSMLSGIWKSKSWGSSHL